MPNVNTPEIETLLIEHAESYTPGILAIAERNGYRDIYLEGWRRELAYVMETDKIPAYAALTANDWRRIAVLGHTTANQAVEVFLENQRKQQEIKTQAQALREAKKLVAGQWIALHINQGNRDALVLAVINDQALIEYYMPRGSSALRIIHAYKQYKIRKVSYSRLSLSWLEAIVAQGTEWDGNAQQSLTRKPSPQERLQSIQEQKHASKKQQGTPLWNQEKL